MSDALPAGPLPVLLNAFAPIVHVVQTPELGTILRRSHLASTAALLTPFSTSLPDPITVRTPSTFQNVHMPRGWGVRFVQQDRELGITWEGEDGQLGAPGGRKRAGTLNASAGAGATFPPTTAPPPEQQQPTTQAERDELFLDSLSARIAAQLPAWLAGSSELAVHRVLPLKKNLSTEEGDRELPVLDYPQRPDEGWRNRTVEELTPWYACMRDEILKRREMVEWETFGWPVAYLLVVSTSHPDPLNALSLMWDRTSPSHLFSHSADKAEWASPSVLRFILVVHDLAAPNGKEGLEDAKALHESVRRTYGLHTAFVPLFGAGEGAGEPLPRAAGIEQLWAGATEAPKPQLEQENGVGLGVSEGQKAVVPAPPAYGKELSETDVHSIQLFLKDLVSASIVPYLERQVIVMNEQYTASRKGIGGRLWGAGRRYFGSSNDGSSPATPGGGTTGWNPIKAQYHHTAQESQNRRLADLAFMLGDFKLAAGVYGQLVKDLKTDKAWRYYSSASRMHGLTTLLVHPPGQPLTYNPANYLSQALDTPLAPNVASADWDTIKGAVLYYEALRAMGDWRAAPAVMEKAAGFHEEASAALLLEQAAIADLHLPLASRRKYAYHMTLAASRYEKCGLKALSRRCLSQASALFVIPSPWVDPRTDVPLTGFRAVRTYLHSSLARQAHNVGAPEVAIGHWFELLREAEVPDEKGWWDDLGMACEMAGKTVEQAAKERGVILPAVAAAPGTPDGAPETPKEGTPIPTPPPKVERPRVAQEEQKPLERLINIALVTLERVEHDFELGPVRVPVTFTISNPSATLALNYVLRLSNAPGLAVFVGSLTRRGKLAPSASKELKVEAWLAHQGVWDVGGRWTCEVEVVADDGTVGAKGVARGRRKEIRVKDLLAVAAQVAPPVQVQVQPPPLAPGMRPPPPPPQQTGVPISVV